MNKEEFFRKYDLSEEDFERCGINWSVLEGIYVDYSGKYERRHWDKLIMDLTDNFESCFGNSVHFIRTRIKTPERLLVKLIRLGLKAGLDGKNLDITEENYPEHIDDIIGIRLVYLQDIEWKKIHLEIIKNYKKLLVCTPVAYVREEEKEEMERFYKDQKYAEYNCAVEVEKWGHHFVKYPMKYKQLDRDWSIEIQTKNIFEEAWWEIGSTLWYSRRGYSNIIDNHIGVLKSLSNQCNKIATYSIFLRDELESRSLQEKVVMPEVERAEAEFSTLKESSIDEIKQMIKLSQTEFAISKLDIMIRKYFKPLEEEITTITARFNRTNANVRMGLLTHSEADVIYNNISDAITKLVKIIEQS